jgi:hypothetical protein
MKLTLSFFLVPSLMVSSLLTACGPRQNVALPANSPPAANAIVAQNTLTATGVVNSRYEYSGDNTELNVIIEQSSGEEMTLQLIRRPVGGSSVSVQTVVKENGQVSSRYRTTPGEAQLAVKLAANNGWRSVYNDLKERYELAGLL